MKRIFLISLMICVLSGTGVYAETDTSSGDHRYDKEDVAHYENVLRAVREMKLDEAADSVPQIKDLELRGMAYYLLAADGYASQGKMEQAIVLMRDAVQSLKQVSGTMEENEEISGPAAQTFIRYYEKFITDIVVATAESRAAGNLDEKTARENIVRALDEIGMVYYRLMAIEKAVLRLPDRNETERLLQDLAYVHSGRDVLSNGIIHTTYDLDSLHSLVIGYGAEPSIDKKNITVKVFTVHHVILDDAEWKKWEESR